MPSGRITYFADVILPLAVPNLFTYRVPLEMNGRIRAGQRVVVQFGKSKLYSALVRKVHESPPRYYEAKYIESILDDEPLVNESQFRLWEWMAAYYMCTVGEVMNAALPSGLKLASETRLLLRNREEAAGLDLTHDEYMIVSALEANEVLTLDEAARVIGKRSAHPLIKTMIEKNIVIIQEDIKPKFKPKVEVFVRITPFAAEEAHLQELLNELEKRAYKQMELLMAYMRLSGFHPGAERPEIRKAELLKSVNASDAVLQGLVRKNALELTERETGRLGEVAAGSGQVVLSPDQQQAMEEVRRQFGKHEVVLLHGVTSSGKTEIYIKLIEEAVAAGKQVLYLLPEIALTAQIINRLRKIFGDQVGVYHSRFNEQEKVEIWNAVIGAGGEKEKCRIILGARSALLLPFSKLGLVIVDEEHDTSYKQFDPAPRYNARDTASYLAHVHGAKTLLGSATPSLESYDNARSGKYGFVELSTRYGGMQMPEILVADVREARKRKQMRSHFTPLLFESIAHALQHKEQVILFQNRRGFAPQQICELCGWSPECVNCDVTLTYHKYNNLLRCHYCAYQVSPPSRCAACGHDVLKLVGFGTEKIEEELQLMFPDAKSARMDLDSTRGKHAHAQLISEFENRHIDILVGTQMVTKGLDFDNVSVVGILNADSMLNFPDFRAFERSFQLMEQVAGRAGRRNKRGRVIIQTATPAHHIIQHVVHRNFARFYADELLERRNFHYPPYYRLIELTLMHREAEALTGAADLFASELKKHLGSRVIGPAFPLVPRIKNLYLKNILVKIEKESSAASVKEVIRTAMAMMHNHPDHKSVRIQPDVDPM
ncbi:MAG: primosomal protein N' [Bacteroidota bacterium]